MASFFVKPENAFKRAEELLAVGRKAEALQVLVDVIASKRFRQWQKVYEDIMIKILDVCVDMRKGKIVKDGLWQYKQMCQQVNIGSLEVVVRHLLGRAEQQAKEAQSLADAKALELVDLDDESDAALVLSTVSGEDTKERADRQLLMPWLRFLWETYRAVLDVLKNNMRLLPLYHEAAAQAFSFCLRYRRRNEFRRLCDLLRQHVTHAQRFVQLPGQPPLPPHVADLNGPEALQMQLETRLAQFDAAGVLELWQEAYKSVEDIRSLLARVRKPPAHAALGAFLAKLANLFWVSDYHLVHAYAVLQHYAHTVSAAAEVPPTAEEVSEAATAVVLAALAVPAQVSRPEDLFEPDAQRERTLRMSRLLGLPANAPALSRENLLAEISSRGIAARASEPARELLALLERTFDPLGVCKRAGAVLDGWLAAQPQRVSQYAPALRRLAVLRLLQQCARVYDVVTIAEFSRLVSPAFASFADAEQYVLQLVQKRAVSLTIDHVEGTLVFRRDGAGACAMARGPLTSVFRALSAVVSRIDPSVAARRVEAKRAAFAVALKSMQTENAALLARADAIERKKVQREAYEQWVRQKEEERRRLEEEKRVAEAKQREAEAAAAAHKAEEQRKKEMLERSKVDQRRGAWSKIAAASSAAASAAPAVVGDISSKSVKAQAALTDAPLPSGAAAGAADDAAGAGGRRLTQKQIEEMAAAKERMEKKIREMSREADFEARARRETEVPKLLAVQEEQKRADRAKYEAQVKANLAADEARHAFELGEKARLARMIGDRDAFAARIRAAREEAYAKAKAEYDALKAEHDKKTEAERKVREEREARERAEREERERKEAAEREAREKAEAERRAAEEAARKKREEEELKQREAEAARREAEEAEQRAKLEKERQHREEALRRQEEQERERERSDAYRAPSGGRDRDLFGRSRDEPFGRPRDREEPAGRWRDEPRREDAYGRSRDEPRREDPFGRARAPREDPFGRRDGPAPARREFDDRDRPAPARDGDRWVPARSDRDRPPSSRFDDRDRPPSSRFDDRERSAPREDRYAAPSDRWARDDRERPSMGPGPAADRWSRDERPPMRRDDREMDRPAPRGDYDRPRAFDRDGPAPARRDDDRFAPRRDDRDGPAPARRDDDRFAPRRDERDRYEAPRRDEPRREEPRRETTPRSSEAPRRPAEAAPAPKQAEPVADDGFTAVVTRRKKK
eukprot:m51a1_g10359 putative eukaryotic translation initiation factor 3a (1208) ;mRNA; r:48378-52595